jgi:hypothetical protein
MEWRVAEITNPAAPAYDPATPIHYEIEPEWESGELGVFASAITVPGGVVEPGHTYRLRVRMQDTTGRWGHWSLPVEFTPTQAISPLKITEVMYHPAEQTAAELAAGGVAYDSEEYEFIELYNAGATPMNLAGYRLANGVEMTIASGTLAPGEYAVVVRNVDAFANRYGTSPKVLGEWRGTPEDYRLANGGETVELVDASGSILLNFAYDDADGWPVEADGGGPSLVIVDPAGPAADWNLPTSWRASTAEFGSPGSDDLVTGDVNGDGRVDLADVAIVQAHLGTTTGASRAQGDLNGDAAVDRLDASLVARHFGRIGAASAPAAVAVRAGNLSAVLDRDDVDTARAQRAAIRRARAVRIAPRAADASMLDAISGIAGGVTAAREAPLIAVALRRAHASRAVAR